MRANAPLGDITDTARWVAYFRALESERGDALFHDRYARKLAGERGERIARGLPKGPLSWSLAVRTRVFDELIADAIQNAGVTLVLNLAAGLDTRPYRLDVARSVRWVEVDLPAIVEWKTAALAGETPLGAVERVAADVTDASARADVLSRVQPDAGRVLIVTEGLLIYLNEAEVASLAVDLRRAYPAGLWLLENIAPSILERQRRLWGKRLSSIDAEHRFAPAAGLAFFRPLGWAPRTTRSLLDEAHRLHREMPLAGLMRFLSSLVPGRDEALRNAVTQAVMAPLS